MSQDPQTLRKNTIHTALQILKNPTGTKRPSVNSVAKRFGLAETTLRRAVKNGIPSRRQGPPKVLTDHEEKQLVGYCINMQKLGFGLTKSGVNHCVMEILQQNGRTHPFNNGPGRDWWARFMRDYPELSFRTPQELSEARAQRANATIVKDHFNKLQQIIHENSLTASQIWNMDETGFVIVPKLEKVIARKGSRQVHKIAHGNSHDHISVAPTISAAGTYIPPLIIYKGVRTIPGLLEGAPPGTVMGFTDTGYMREDLFQMYLTHFINSISPTRPVLLMLDGHKSHVSYTSVDFCRQNGILLYALPPHTTHVLQPSELPFAKLKKEYNKECDQFRITNNGELVTKYTFAKVFGQAFIKTYTPMAISNAYKATGIWPLDFNAIHPYRLDPSLTTEEFSLPCSQVSNPVASSSLFQTRAKELQTLKTENEQLKEELETYKNPGTCSLRSVLKYPSSRKHPLIEAPSLENQTESLCKKKRKTLPFAQLLTNEESWRELERINEEAKKKALETSQRKEEAARKRALLEQKKEEKARKKEEQARKKEQKKKRVNIQNSQENGQDDPKKTWSNLRGNQNNPKKTQSNPRGDQEDRKKQEQTF